ncbi:hypothetical protein [Hydrogenophaga sp. NH-16]|jgi:hypothetical protein|uniref:hypothetical protein n=1 Tax=Hydrogenophaga sp. NH-16 TaxID=2184519 RepID=UPI000FD9B0FB|nr:hypothetical protein [Hydrogenophaga sp. NH-16]
MEFLGGGGAFSEAARDGTDFAVLDAGQVDLWFDTSGTNAGDSGTGICLDNHFSPDGRALRCARIT